MHHAASPHAPSSPGARRAQAGFSLIELMIALVIGMVAVIVMMQMMTNADTAKRITVGGNDAQMSGTIALYNLERDIRMSGYGINAGKLIACEMTHTATEAKVAVKFPLVPVTINPTTAIVPAGDKNSDTLLVIHGSADESADGDPLTAATTADIYNVTTASAFRKDQYVVAQSVEPASPCQIKSAKVKEIAGADLSVEGGEAGISAGGVVYNLGTLTARAYVVRNGALTVCDYALNDCSKPSLVDDEDVWVPVASHIVALRAQYGRDLANLTAPPMAGVVNTYSQKQPGMDSTESALTPQCAWARTLSLRVGLVARGDAYEKKAVDQKAPTWSGARTSDDNPDVIVFDLSASTGSTDKDEWRKFRHKTFETNIPLRNAIWQGDNPC